jgi:hypothetical protein
MSIFKDFLARVSGANSVQQFKAVAGDAAAIGESAGKLEACFASAGLDFSAALADENYLARALAAIRDESTDASAKLSAEVGELKATLSTYEAVCAGIGIAPGQSAEQVKQSFDANVAKRASALLAEQGMPKPIADAPSDSAKLPTSDEIIANYKATEPGSAERIALIEKHRATIYAAREKGLL